MYALFLECSDGVAEEINGKICCWGEQKGFFRFTTDSMEIYLAAEIVLLFLLF